MSAEIQLKLKNAESSIAFMREQHAKTLEGLHKEIQKLQQKNASEISWWRVEGGWKAVLKYAKPGIICTFSIHIYYVSIHRKPLKLLPHWGCRGRDMETRLDWLVDKYSYSTDCVLLWFDQSAVSLGWEVLDFDKYSHYCLLSVHVVCRDNMRWFSFSSFSQRQVLRDVMHLVCCLLQDWRLSWQWRGLVHSLLQVSCNIESNTASDVRNHLFCCISFLVCWSKMTPDGPKTCPAKDVGLTT